MVSPNMPAAMQRLLDQWMVKSAEAVRGYYSMFPVPVLDLHVTAIHGAGIGGGRARFDDTAPSAAIRRAITEKL